MKTLFAVWLIFAVALLASCSGDTQTRATSSLAVGCEAGATMLSQLALRRSKDELSPDLIRKVNSAKGVLDSVCMPDSPFDPASVTATVQNAITILGSILHGRD